MKKLLALLQLSILLTLSLPAFATWAPVSDAEKRRMCYPGSDMLQSDVCWGKVYSKEPSHPIYPTYPAEQIRYWPHFQYPGPNYRPQYTYPPIGANLPPQLIDSPRFYNPKLDYYYRPRYLNPYSINYQVQGI